MNKLDQLEALLAKANASIMGSMDNHDSRYAVDAYRDELVRAAPALIAAARLLQELTCTARAGYDGAGIPGVTLGQLDRASAILSRLESP